MVGARCRTPALLLLVLLAVLAGAACGGSDDTSERVRPFSEVQVGEQAFARDPSDASRAIFRVRTKDPMICAIVWGETDDFGRFNNSLAMNGTGIEEHDVVLPDVEPDVSYRYVVQGTTADGTLYRSDVGTFRVAAAPRQAAGPDRGPNLARDATVADVSSEFSRAFRAEHALDGDTGTEWATRGDGDDGAITIDLGREQPIGGVEFLTRSMADGSSITDSFTVSVDDAPALGPFAAGTVNRPRFAPVDASGRRLRFEVASSSGGNVGAVEIRVFGPEP
jgi:hypothetical protein